MAIAFDAAASGEANPGTSVTYAHTVSGTSRLLLVGIATNATTDKVTGVTYNGVAMTRGDSQQATTTNFYCFWYYLLNPDTGTNNVVVSLSSSDACFVMSASYTGVSQSGFPDSQNKGTDAAGNFAADTTVVLSNCWLWATGRSNGTITCTNGTVRAGRQSDNEMCADSNGTVSTGSQSLNFSVSPGGETAWLIASFAPATAGPANVKTWDGITQSTGIKTYQGVAVASVKSVNGVT